MRVSRRKPNGLAADGKGGLLAAGLLPPDRQIPDIPPAEAVRPVDLVDRRIRALLRLGDRVAASRDAEHAPAICGYAAAVGSRTGVENLNALDRSRRIEPRDRRTLPIAARIDRK